MNDASFVGIPEELQIYILSRLPPKSLSRCKCVSKHWYTALTVKAFWLRHSVSYGKHPKLAFVACSTVEVKNKVLSIKINDDNTPKTTAVTVAKPPNVCVMVVNCFFTPTGGTESTEEIIRAQDVYLTDFHKIKYTCMSNICNDLICLSIDSSKRVGLLNIRTLDFIHLPEVTESEIALGFWYALGFDPVSKVFKVLCIYSEINMGYNTKAAILTVGSKYWNRIEYDCLPYSLMCSLYTTHPFCLDGVIYWVHEHDIQDDMNHMTMRLNVVAFDLNHEAFSEYRDLVVTPIEDVETYGFYLTSLKGCPTLFSWKIKSDENHEIQQLTLYNHKNPNASWTARSFISQDFPMMFSYRINETSVYVVGGNILLQYAESIQSTVISEEQDDTKSSRYILYDLENFAVK
ncbi:putative F-box protein At2g02030 [Silene latifolia]|uniref:putative F-box protein At2g02030 n=1 Tax=Silene latifolia TaxID=37657 RepID=UPI003D7880FD